jgi:hypothetical protein
MVDTKTTRQQLNRLDAIGTACHNAVWAMARETEKAEADQRSVEYCCLLAAALQAIHPELTADMPDVSLPFSLQDCTDHLLASAAPRRGQA